MHVINERDLILVIVERQHQIVGTEENILKYRSTKTLDFKKGEYEEYKIYQE